MYFNQIKYHPIFKSQLLYQLITLAAIGCNGFINARDKRCWTWGYTQKKKKKHKTDSRLIEGGLSHTCQLVAVKEINFGWSWNSSMLIIKVIVGFGVGIECQLSK